MSSVRRSRLPGRAPLAMLLLASSIGLLLLSNVVSASTSTGPSMLPSKSFVSAPPTGATGPDDITLLASPGVDGGQAVVWTAFQNGIQPNGTAGSPGGATQSTLAGYDLVTGNLVKTIQVTGKVDGLTADTELGQLIATVNEDDLSAFNLVNPASGVVTTYQYSPNPAVSGVGGTDSIAVWQGLIFVAHSNPNDTTQATEYQVTLDSSTMTANLTPVFYDNSMATNALTGSTVKLALTDPDTNFVMGADLVTVSQGDGVIVFDSNIGTNPQLTVLPLTDNKAGNLPPVDGFAVATSDQGTLFVVDAGTNSIQALDTTGWPTGTVFVGEPSDNSNPRVGVLNLSTGAIAPFTNAFTSPKGILFVPASASAVASTTTVTTTTTQAVTSTEMITTTETTTSTANSSALPLSYLAVGVVPILGLALAVLAIGRLRARPLK